MTRTRRTQSLNERHPLLPTSDYYNRDIVNEGTGSNSGRWTTGLLVFSIMLVTFGAGVLFVYTGNDVTRNDGALNDQKGILGSSQKQEISQEIKNQIQEKLTELKDKMDEAVGMATDVDVKRQIEELKEKFRNYINGTDTDESKENSEEEIKQLLEELKEEVGHLFEVMIKLNGMDLNKEDSAAASSLETTLLQFPKEGHHHKSFHEQQRQQREQTQQPQQAEQPQQENPFMLLQSKTNEYGKEQPEQKQENITKILKSVEALLDHLSRFMPWQAHNDVHDEEHKNGTIWMNFLKMFGSMSRMLSDFVHGNNTYNEKKSYSKPMKFRFNQGVGKRHGGSKTAEDDDEGGETNLDVTYGHANKTKNQGHQQHMENFDFSKFSSLKRNISHHHGRSQPKSNEMNNNGSIKHHSVANIQQFNNSDKIGEVFRRGFNKLDHRHVIEKNLIEKGIKISKNSAASYHQKFLKSDPRVRGISETGLMKELTSQSYKTVFNDSTSFNQIYANNVNYMDSIKNKKIWMEDHLINNHDTRCWSGNIYRHIDGTCNNLYHPYWGASFTPYHRLLDPAYEDGISIPRHTHLPNARHVSVSLNSFAGKLMNSNYTLISMLWGLFIDHDLTNTAITELPDGEAISCCHPEVLKDPKNLKHPECFSINVASNDPFYRDFNYRCMEFIRSAPTCGTKEMRGVFGSREQLNQITSYLDGSVIYGSTDEKAKELRGFSGGKLRDTLLPNSHGARILPLNPANDSFCGKPADGLFCFKAGDVRANEQLELTVLHTIWLREHNRIADELAKINDHWNDDKIYEETRKIIGAQLQQITYNEYLPLLVGTTKGLKLETGDNYYNGYDRNIDASLSNVFAAAAFRFGHSQVQSYIQIKENKFLPLHLTFFNPSQIYEKDGIDSVIKGITQQRSAVVGPYVTEELTNHLFQPTNQFHGLDLQALTIQRGRDHGIPSYVNWVELCLRIKESIKTWRDLEEVKLITNHSSLALLKYLYKNPQDIDLIVGGLLEQRPSEVMLPPTLACIVEEQFIRTRKGDRFWYENGHFVGSFIKEQLKELRKVTLAKILCDNSDNINKMPRNVFLPTHGQRMLDCDSIPGIDFSQWKEFNK